MLGPKNRKKNIFFGLKWPEMVTKWKFMFFVNFKTFDFWPSGTEILAFNWFWPHTRQFFLVDFSINKKKSKVHMAYFVQSFLLIIFPKFILVQILPTTQKNSQNHQESWPKWAPKWSIMKISSKVNKIWLISFQIFYSIYSRNLFSS